jgi:hypothetical protein
MNKKKTDYFGGLNKYRLHDLTPEKKIKLFISKKLYNVTQVMNISLNKPVNLVSNNQYKKIHEPTKELLNAYYSYVVHVYLENINSKFIDFFHSFNNQTLGLRKKDAKIIGRLHFLGLINNKHSPNFDIVRMSESSSGIPSVDNAPKLELYFIKQEALKYRLAHEYEKGLYEFLMGNSDHFNNRSIGDNSIVQEIIQFESDLKILLSLNEKYKFEKFITSQATIKEKQKTTINSSMVSPKYETLEKELSMPSEKEMDDYLLKNVFSKKV